MLYPDEIWWIYTVSKTYTPLHMRRANYEISTRNCVCISYYFNADLFLSEESENKYVRSVLPFLNVEQSLNYRPRN